MGNYEKKLKIRILILTNTIIVAMILLALTMVILNGIL